MHQLKQKIIKYRIILSLLFAYFLIHLTNLTLLPPYNDESIYLDWAWSYTHMPGHLYDSLLDAKQPLMLWLFGSFENFFTDPLFAGRLVAVLFGAFSLIGIYTVAKNLFNKKIAIVAVVLYSIVPIFVFYNRQALMEAAIVCIGIWGFHALRNVIHKPTNKNGVVLGIILGIGFFIKSSTLLYIASSILIISFYIFKKRKTEIIKPFLFSLLSFFCVNILLFINPTFWDTFSTNSRYSFTLAELFAFPLNEWVSHLLGFFEIGFFFVTPLVFLFGLTGIILMRKDKIKDHQIFYVYFILALLLEIFLGRYQNQRYLSPFLPFLLIPASYVFSNLWKGNLIKKSVVTLSFLLPLASSILLVVTPDYYIMQLSKISKYSNVEHVRGQMSGYGIKEVMEYIKEHSIPSQPTLVLFALNSGNPENAVDVYASKDPQLYALHIDAKFFPGIEQYDCLTSKYPAFFVTRYDQRVGMDRYFSVLTKSFPNPDGKYSLGIYTLKKDCKGKAASLSDFYQGAIDRIYQIRAGLAL